jgi:hypothetical protein
MTHSTAQEPSVLSVSSESEQDKVPPPKSSTKSTKQFIGKALKQKPKLKYIDKEDSNDRAFIDDSALNKGSPDGRLVH